MQREELRALQAPLKDRYGTEPSAARITLTATGSLGDGVSCSVQAGRAVAEAGLHPATGGDETLLCSGDMLLEALVACAERYCVVYQTLAGTPALSTTVTTGPAKEA
jgi:hypothetical protein